jgi:hypothetical protein
MPPNAPNPGSWFGVIPGWIKLAFVVAIIGVPLGLWTVAEAGHFIAQTCIVIKNVIVAGAHVIHDAWVEFKAGGGTDINTPAPPRRTPAG